jgi:hypothetical protein
MPDLGCCAIGKNVNSIIPWQKNCYGSAVLIFEGEAIVTKLVGIFVKF